MFNTAFRSLSLLRLAGAALLGVTMLAGAASATPAIEPGSGNEGAPDVYWLEHDGVVCVNMTKNAVLEINVSSSRTKLVLANGKTIDISEAELELAFGSDASGISEYATVELVSDASEELVVTVDGQVEHTPISANGTYTFTDDWSTHEFYFADDIDLPQSTDYELAFSGAITTAKITARGTGRSCPGGVQL